MSPHMNKKKNKPKKAYTKESTVTGIGNGLFAQTDIKKGSIIAEFKGRLKQPHDRSNSKNDRSNIFFHDNSILQCPETDLASFANDCINFTCKRRKLMEALQSNEPFYKKYPGSTLNASIEINNDLHRAFLKAETDIKKDEEIFCHYGFTYWFMKEITTVGFLEEDYIEKHGFPNKLFDHPGFISYIHEFYTDVKKIEFHQYDEDTTDVNLHLNDGTFFCMPIRDYSRLFSRVPANEANQMINNPTNPCI